MIAIDVLRSELQGRLRLLSEDLIERAKDVKIKAELKNAFDKLHEGGRTSQSFEMWQEDFLEQVAVAWLLACMFVRFMEDNELIRESWIAGDGECRKRAEDALELFFKEHRLASEREYFQHVFHEVGKIKAAQDLFAEGKTPLWAMGPSADAARNLLNYWREIEPETGLLKRSFKVENADTRFLGDLYQDLSEKAKKKYALLQTPVFVEEFILDRTLTPALDEFGLKNIRLIDPTCGSGHFLLGAFERLYRLWEKPAYSTGKATTDVQNALDGVWGVDINPFAVAIARFRLIVAALHACDIKLLKQAPAWDIHLATGDSLLFGSFPIGDGRRDKITHQGDFLETPAIFAVEDKAALQHILGQGYHVVVGNPPYITVKDAAQNQAYRNLYETCYRKYSLGAPFTERFWQLAIQKGEDGAHDGGYIGMITTNSFMKREFGKKLIEEFFPKVDLTHVVNSAIAPIPGHTTPTVILFGRNRKPVSDVVRTVFGIRKDPDWNTSDPSLGIAWKSIVSHINRCGSRNDYVSVADWSRKSFGIHPWTLMGGGAVELKESIENSATTFLRDHTDSIGFGAVIGEEEAFCFPVENRYRLRVEDPFVRPVIQGDQVRDWCCDRSLLTLFPYDDNLELVAVPSLLNHLWPLRTLLENRADFNNRTYAETGRAFWEYHQIPVERNRTSGAIAFAEVVSHNHFVLDRGGNVLKQTAPMIKLGADATLDDYLAILGLLNSSTACFWLKQVCFPKDGTSQWDERYQHSSSKVENFPLPEGRSPELSRQLDALGRRYGECLPGNAFQKSVPAKKLVDDIRTHAASIRRQMISLQEELDWHCYELYSLLSEDLRYSGDDLPELELGQRAFEIVMARQMEKGELETTWFDRHGSTPITEIPAHLPKAYRKLVERRIKLIETNKEIGLIEKPEYKRRWNTEAWEDQEKQALKNWLLDRLESSKYRRGTDRRPELTTTSQMADVAATDKEFRQVAELYTGRPDFNMANLVAELVESESVPLLPCLRYKATGIRKRAVWENVWELQRRQDAGEDVGTIPVPPKYATADFQKTDYWRLRGKLDVPKERWVSFPHCSPDGDPSLVVAWAGWSQLQQAQAVTMYYVNREKTEGWSSQRLTPLLTALDQLLPWVFQWHPIDPDTGASPGEEFRAVLEEDARKLELTLETIRQWTPPVRGGRR